jgi:hypothetical protein
MYRDDSCRVQYLVAWSNSSRGTGNGAQTRLSLVLPWIRSNMLPLTHLPHSNLIYHTVWLIVDYCVWWSHPDMVQAWGMMPVSSGHPKNFFGPEDPKNISSGPKTILRARRFWRSRFGEDRQKWSFVKTVILSRNFAEIPDSRSFAGYPWGVGVYKVFIAG